MAAKLRERLAGAPAFARRHPLLVSAVAVAAVMLVSGAMFGPRYIINDDRSMNNILQGAAAGATPFGVFMNPLLSWLLYLLYQATPGLDLNWLTCLEYLLYYCGFVAICYVLLTPAQGPARLFPAGVFCLVAVPLFTVEITFTLAASTGFTGGTLLLFHQLRRKMKWYALVPPVLLCAVAFMLRYNSALLALPFVGLAAVCAVFKWENLHGPKRFAREYVKYILGFALLLVFVFGLRWGGKALERAHPTEAPQYSNSRARFIDYPKLGYDDIGEELEALGISENTYALILEWTNADPEVFWSDIWTQLKALQLQPSLYFGVARLTVEYLPMLMGLPLYPVGLALAVAAAGLAARRRAGWGAVLSPVLLQAAFHMILLYLCVRGRLTAAVTNGCLLAMVCALLYSLPAPEEEKAGLNMKAAAAGLLSLAMLCVPTALHLVSCYFSPAVDTAARALATELTAREDDIFLMHSDLRLWRAYGVFERSSPQGNLVSLGGWGAMHPATLKQYEALGITSPMRDLDRDNVYVLADDDGYMERLVLYFEEYTGRDADFELAEKLGGQKIYKVTAAG